jgi:hypothetical protein
MLNEPYVAINQLIKSIGKGCRLKQFFDIHVLGGKYINPMKNDQDRDF